jgi:hypothetical protein
LFGLQTIGKLGCVLAKLFQRMLDAGANRVGFNGQGRGADGDRQCTAAARRMANAWFHAMRLIYPHFRDIRGRIAAARLIVARHCRSLAFEECLRGDRPQTLPSRQGLTLIPSAQAAQKLHGNSNAFAASASEGKMQMN